MKTTTAIMALLPMAFASPTPPSEPPATTSKPNSLQCLTMTGAEQAACNLQANWGFDGGAASYLGSLYPDWTSANPFHVTLTGGETGFPTNSAGWWDGGAFISLYLPEATGEYKSALEVAASLQATTSAAGAKPTNATTLTGKTTLTVGATSTGAAKSTASTSVAATKPSQGSGAKPTMALGAMAGALAGVVGLALAL